MQTIISVGSIPDWVRNHFEASYRFLQVDDSDRHQLYKVLGPEVIALIPRGSMLIDGEIMDRAPNLKVIARTGVGFDTVVIEEANKRGIVVLYTPDAMSRAVAEHTLALILAAAKDLRGWQQALISSHWIRRYESLNLDLEEKTLGIVGYGRIGKQVRQLVRCLDLQVLVHDPYLDPLEFTEDEVSFTSLDQLLSRSDVVTLHVPLTSETRHLINIRNLSLFKDGAILVNTSRGAVVESLDLLQHALGGSGKLSAVGLDVFPEEPVPADHPLLQNPRAIVTGHVAARTVQAQERILETMVNDLQKVLQGHRPHRDHVVNPIVLSKPEDRS